MFGISCSSVGVAFLILLLVICAVSESARYRTKFTAFIVFSAIAATCPIPLMLLRPRDWRNALLPAWGSRRLANLLGISFKIRGKENIVQDSGCVVIINHQSALDLCVLAELWPVLRNCAVISKKLILYLGPFGLATWLWGTIFIDRTKVVEAQNTVNSTSSEITRRKAKLLIFAEGKRHSGNTLLPFKKGAFHLAIGSQTPIQPVVVSKYYFLNSIAKKFDSGSSYITILPPIPTKGLTKEDLPKLMDQAWEAMNTTFQQSSIESLAEHKKRTHQSGKDR